MLHSEKARINHSADRARVHASSAQAFATDTASQLQRDGAPMAHIQHMINKGYVINDL